MTTLQQYLELTDPTSQILDISNISGYITEDINTQEGLRMLYIHDSDVVGPLPIITTPLTDLVVSYTSIDNVDEFLSNLPDTIMNVTINNCQLTSIHISNENKSLRSLRLQNNLISSIRGLQRLSNIRVLDLSGNQLVNVAGLHTLSRLSYLNVSHNKIRQLPGLQDVQTLQYLNGSHNKLIYVPKNYNVQYMLLANNLLLSIDGVKSPVLLDVHNNPIGDKNNSYSLPGYTDISDCSRTTMTIHCPWIDHVYKQDSPVTVERFDPDMAYSMELVH